ncbi:serine acetyltransferase [Candidatus Aminicenantes bacterium AC-334-K16]|nr:serine acetyltransferase [Candidatus Aminicenantes bacterium AC-334-K16]
MRPTQRTENNRLAKSDRPFNGISTRVSPTLNNSIIINKTVDVLLHSYQNDLPPFLKQPDLKFPEIKEDRREILLLKEILFPNYWNAGEITLPQNTSLLEAKLIELIRLFQEGLKADATALAFENSLPRPKEAPHLTALSVVQELPNLREILKKDVTAAYHGDPAAKSYTEIIRSYPGFEAIMVHRVAHLFYLKNYFSYARELSEYIHSKTGIDIHPGARIGEYFFIDHGTGVVIGETSVLGHWVRIYQDVTLGVLHFEREGDLFSPLKKNYQRHPRIGNYVVIGAGAKILGPVTIGDHVNIGANSWITEDIPNRMTVFVEHPKLERRVIQLARR